MMTVGPAAQKRGYIVVRESIANVFKIALRGSSVSKRKALMTRVIDLASAPLPPDYSGAL